MKYTLVADGASDAILIPILTWSVRRCIASPVESQWTDFSRIPLQPDFESKLRVALDLFPCDVLFVHRDAEGQPPEWRRNEIAAALKDTTITHVPVVPVRMTEAWFLFDESAIRAAAGNPNGKENLNLPGISTLEDIPDAKQVLYKALSQACGRNVRRRSTFPVSKRVHLLPNYIDDYSPLKVLSAFQTLQQDIRSIFL